jgi:signal transduction histidine kinase
VQILSKDAQRSPENAELLDIIKSETARLNMIVSDFLAYGRPRSPVFQSVDLHESIDEALRLVGRDDRFAESLTVVRDFIPQAPSVRADPGQLRQVFLNLFLNAVQAMGSHGTLTIETRRRDGSVHIVVADTGPGIPADDLPRLFEPFQSRRVGGMGLGLATVRRIIEDHGGRISADSRLGTGTRILISLPHGA